MEKFASTVEYMDRFHDMMNVDPGPTLKAYRRALDNFYLSLPRLFRQAIGRGTCTHHSLLAVRLHVDDVLISFNPRSRAASSIRVSKHDGRNATRSVQRDPSPDHSLLFSMA